MSPPNIPEIERRFPFRPGGRDAGTRVFCFPFAGGSASVFRDWPTRAPATYDVWPVELPGRGTRFGERPLSDLGQLADDAVRGMRPVLGSSVVLFGHSMGARIAAEVARRLGSSVRALVVSASTSPAIPRKHPIARLPNAAFVAEITSMGGTPRAVLDDPELLALFLPVLRADFEALEGYRPSPDRVPLDVPLLALYGTDDREVDLAGVEAWREETRGAFELRAISGDHFYVATRRDHVMREVFAFCDRHA